MGNLVLGMAVLGKSALDRRGYPARRFPFLKWPDSRGTGGRFAVEQVAGLPWNRWPISRGIRTWIADTAKVHDSQHLEAALDEWNTSAEIYADKGYVGADREERLREQGYRPQIQRKAKPGKALSACQERRNRRIAKVRARVEHVFAAIHQWGGKQIRTIGQARATFAMGMMVVVYNMRRLAFLGA
ncbi:transposase, IS5 family (plasmid) [Acidithiobacillus caldus SM-1]|uniref:Transposase, IS5 family n=1 Tax=Acidithiobacillus caldus (strain SM-1) TaxID=990288 RepID=F9ZUE1_ACICS|nr:transposase, IS5 family [Acidithiobacillus caldus SM-1]